MGNGENSSGSITITTGGEGLGVTSALGKRQTEGGYGEEYLKRRQKEKLANWEANPNKSWKAAKKRQDWLEKQAPDLDWQKQQRADEMALQMAGDIDTLREKIAAGETGMSDAEIRQMQEGAQTAAAQQLAAQQERQMQEAMASGQSAAQAAAQTALATGPVNTAAETAAKASRDAWMADQAKKAQEAQQYQAMRAAYTGSYDESSHGGGAEIWQALLQSGLEGGSQVLSSYVDQTGGETADVKKEV